MPLQTRRDPARIIQSLQRKTGIEQTVDQVDATKTRTIRIIGQNSCPGDTRLPAQP